MIRIGFILINVLLQTTAHAAPTWAEVEAVTDWESLTEKRHKVAGTVSVFNKEVSGTPAFAPWQQQPPLQML